MAAPEQRPASPRLVFAGTPAFAVPSLEALIESGMPPRLVLTQPDRPAGRGRKLEAGPVKRRARAAGIPVAQPATLINKEKTKETPGELAELEPDAIVVVAYGLLLPREIIELPRAGCINVHASLLPRWRGAAPVEAALLAGDAETGVSLMRMDEGLDTGPVYAQTRLRIGEAETTGELKERLAGLGARLLVERLPEILQGRLAPAPQDAAAASYAPKVKREDARLDWALPAVQLARRVRAYHPDPGARFELGDETVKCRAAAAVEGPAAEPGTVLAVPGRAGEGLDIACGDGVLRVLEVQRPGRGRISAFELASQVSLAGRRLPR